MDVVIGDIHGCWASLEALLAQLEEAGLSGARLWATGDLVNGGPRSLEVLRWAAAHPALQSVLGNHDLYCLARAAGVVPRKGRDTLDALLGAPDREALVDWLRSRPLLVREPRFSLVHAGLLPSWSIDDAARHAGQAEAALRGEGWRDFLAEYFADTDGMAALRALVTLRTCRADGRPCRHKGPPDEAPRGCRPWFAWRTGDEPPVVFGHWAALGLHRSPTAVALDSGCVWGGALSAICFDDEGPGALFEQNARD